MTLKTNTGGVRDVDLVDRLRSADCVVHVAHGEGFGLPLVESLSCGVPVACTADGRVMQEIVGDAGILIDTDHMIKDASGNTYKDVQPEEWAQTMARIYHDFQDKSRMCNHRRIAYERSLAFDWKNNFREYSRPHTEQWGSTAEGMASRIVSLLD